MTDNRDGLLGRLFGRGSDADAETDPETEIQPSLPDAGGGVDEFHEVVEHAAGAGVDPGRIDELRMEMILEEGQHDEPQEARDADDEDGQAGLERADGAGQIGEEEVSLPILNPEDIERMIGEDTRPSTEPGRRYSGLHPPGNDGLAVYREICMGRKASWRWRSRCSTPLRPSVWLCWTSRARRLCRS